MSGKTGHISDPVSSCDSLGLWVATPPHLGSLIRQSQAHGGHMMETPGRHGLEPGVAGAGSCRTQVHGDQLLCPPFSAEGCVMAGTHVPTLLPAGQSSCVSLPQCRGSRHGWPEAIWCWFFIGCEHQQDGIPLHGGPTA